MDDFENKLTELHDRVLSKALTEDEQNSYTESLFESIKHINEYGEEFLVRKRTSACSRIY